MKSLLLHAGLFSSLVSLSAHAQMLDTNAEAQAAESQTVDGRFRLGLEASVLAHESGTISSAGVEADADTTQGGLPGGGFGAVFGYGVSSAFVLGARFAWATTEQKFGDVEADASQLSFLPYAEYVFSGGSFRPHLNASLGIALESSRAADIDSSAFVFGAGAGAHWFLREGVSLDPGISLSRLIGTTTLAGAELDRGATRFVASLGLSVWLGGSSERPSTAVTTNTASPAAVTDIAAAHTHTASKPKPSRTAEVVEPTRSRAPAMSSDLNGRLFLTLTAETGRVARITGHPSKNGRQLVLEVQLPPDVDSSRCQEGWLYTDDLSHPITGAKVRSGRSAATLIGIVPVEALAKVANTEGSGFRVCSEDIQLEASSRRSLVWFVGKFQEVAERYGTWNPRTAAEPVAKSAESAVP